MSIFEDQGSIQAAYEDVRDDSTETKWVALHYEGGGKLVSLFQTGVGYEEFLNLLPEDERIYGYVRFDLEDGAKRFVFVTWIGPSVPPLKKAKVSTDKAFVKQIFVQFRVEILADEKNDLKKEKVLDRAQISTPYGTGR